MVMRKINKTNQVILTAFIIISTLFGSCEKDVFNPELVKATYADRFPVKDIDPLMDWKMTQSITVTVAVYEDEGVDYTIRIYDANPLESTSSAKLLAEGTANNDQPFKTIMDCPIALTDVFICRIDNHNRNVIKYAAIENNAISTTFGVPTSTKSLTRTATKGVTRVTAVNPDYTESEINALASNAKELNNSTILFSGDVYKISQGNTYTGNITTWGIYGTVGIVIIQGTWSPSISMLVNRGIDLIVTSTGKIILPNNSNLSLIGSTRFINLAGGNIQGNKARITLSNGSEGRTNYNQGNLTLNEFNMSGTGTLYNSGTSTITRLNLNNSGGKFINEGQATIGSTSSNSTVENGCYLSVTDQFKGDLVLGDNCAATINEYPSTWGKNITLGDNSMLTITKAYFGGTKFHGSNKPSLIKVKTLANIQLSTNAAQGNIYFEFDELNSNWEKETWRNMSYLTYYSTWGESPVIIPAGDCTGSGNTPNGSGTDTPTTPVLYTYVYEDNFPLVGDYDFNDIVLDVSTIYHRDATTNAIQTIELDVTLTAAGASKTLGAGLRIVGISKSDISNITTDGDAARFQETLTAPRNQALNFFKYNSGSYMENGDNNIVIPLFNNAHQVFGVPDGTLTNTQSTKIGSVNGQPTYTYKLIIQPKDQTKTDPLFSKDNLDFFICSQYKTMKQRMEVHLYEFWSYGATAAGTVQQENLDLAGNNTWAVCVPNFRYPKENVNISISSSPSEGAYPNFLDWARNRTTNQDWYLYPNADKVCR